MPQTIAVLDFGSQLTQVIARRIRECQVYSKIFHFSTPAEKLREEGVAGIILSGGPMSVFAKKAPHPDPAIFELGVPVLGICYGGWELAYPTPTRLPAMFVFPVSIALGLVGARRVRG